MNQNKSDIQLKQDIEAELGWDPKINASHIGVSVEQGAVSLLGEVGTYAERWAAEEAVRRVGGVRVVAHGLTVTIQEHHQRSDLEIAKAVSHALKWDVFVPAAVTAKVECGVVTLGGVVQWSFQRHEAVRTIRNLVGVVGVNNNIILQPETATSVWKENLEDALEREAAWDEPRIHIEASGDGTVTLTGRATTWKSITDAIRSAWESPGVTGVVDRVTRPMSD